MTRSKQTTKAKPEEEEEETPDTLALSAQACSLDRLLEKYGTQHLPDTHTLTLADGTRIEYKLLKTASAFRGIETRAALVQRVCQNRERVEKEWPELLPLLPIDYLLLRDAVTVQDCLLPPFAFTLAQAVQLGKTCGSLLSDIAGEVWRMSQPDAWPKPAATEAGLQIFPQDAQEAA